jgi:hypothetical protein
MKPGDRVPDSQGMSRECESLATMALGRQIGDQAVAGAMPPRS